MRLSFWRAAVWFGLVCVGTQARTQKAPAAKDGNPDSLRVIAHIALNDSSPCRLTTAEHWRRQYLYLDHSQTSNLTIIDITNAAQPLVAKEVNRGEIIGEIRLMVGYVGLVTSPETETAPKAVSIVSFADPKTPKLQQTFKNVTGFARGRGFVFIVNDEGLWILQEQPGRDLELEKEYEHHVLYDR